MRDVGTQDEVVVNELYASVQGEGTHAGEPCAFVRLTGCGLRCVWCDSAYAFEEGARRAVADVVREVVDLGLPLVLLTGGEPLEQPGCLTLATALCDAGLTVLIETGGHVDTAPLDARVIRVLDVKCPGSKMHERNRLENLALLRAEDEVKFVVADRADYEFAADIVRRHGLADRRCAVLVSPVHGILAPAELAGWLTRSPIAGARLNLQLQKYIWPEHDRGV
jgi:7-carboxy-7-deazaguanine synthase